MAFSLMAVALFGALFWLFREPLAKSWRRHQLGSRSFPAEWREHIRRRVPYFSALPADLQLKLKRLVQVFLAETPFIGCNGLEITDEMRVTIAAQACLLLLNRRIDYFPNLREVLVYPDRFIVDREEANSAGLVTRQRQVLSGESWLTGQVILSWQDVLEDAARPGDGHNVVVHEFAHQLDQETGSANGAPFISGRSRSARWADVLGREYAELQQRASTGQESLIGDYAATSPAEFFAVVSELFFERPRDLASEHPSLYAEFCNYYRVNPLSW
jgi:Mlc titration factor MtfA (ptsG expression regulator)